MKEHEMKIARRKVLAGTLFGTGLLGLRAIATGLPISLLANPRRALAGEPPCADPSKAQFVIFNTSWAGDSFNCNCPGTYDDPSIVHPLDPLMAPTSLTLGGQVTKAAAPWATLPQKVLDRSCFFHMMTNTPVHAKESNVLELMGATAQGEMLPSIAAKHAATCLGTVQTQPISLGAASPLETITFGGMPQPTIPPYALRSTLTSPSGALTTLQPIRDQALDALYDVYKNGATPAQRAYVDSLVTSQRQVRSIDQNALATLASLKDNSPAAQIAAAVALIQMKVTPVIAVHVPFGGDNHSDSGLATETAQTVAGVATIASLMAQLSAAGLADRVTFVSLNVFGRTLGPGNENGRQHNGNHQVSLVIGKSFAGGVIGGVGKVAKDYGAVAIGNVAPEDTLASFGKTVLTGLGIESEAVAAEVTSGAIIAPALG
jgi:hypothetical protein